MKVTMADAALSIDSRNFVLDVLESGWLSRHKYLPEFEQAVARIHGQQHGIMMNSGTDALRIGLSTLKEVYEWPDGSEVIIPSVTFVATANAVLQTGLKPVFADVDRNTYNIAPAQIAAQIRTSTVALIAVHLFGLPADMPAVIALARKHNLRVLEDSCECFGVHKIQGDMAAFSFFMSHHITTGVGGVLTTNEPRLDGVARSFQNHGRVDDGTRFEFGRIGYSSRATEMEAALGCGQLKTWPENLRRRQEIASKIQIDLAQPPYTPIQIPGPLDPQRSSWMMFPIVLREGSRDALMQHLRDNGIESRQMMPLINQACYKHLVKEDDYPVAQWINQNGLCLPCHPFMTDEQVDYLVECVKVFFK